VAPDVGRMGAKKTARVCESLTDPINGCKSRNDNAKGPNAGDDGVSRAKTEKRPHSLRRVARR
jgi:hypothetical protein